MLSYHAWLFIENNLNALPDEQRFWPSIVHDFQQGSDHTLLVYADYVEDKGLDSDVLRGKPLEVDIISGEKHSGGDTSWLELYNFFQQQGPWAGAPNKLGHWQGFQQHEPSREESSVDVRLKTGRNPGWANRWISALAELHQ